MRGAGVDKAVQPIEKRIGVVATQVIGGVEVRSSQTGEKICVDDGPGCIRRAVFAVRAAGEQAEARSAECGVRSGIFWFRLKNFYKSCEHKLLIPAAFAANV